MGIFQRLTGAGSDKRRTITERDQEQNIVVEECFCPNGHSLITQQAVFASYPGITLALKNEHQSGLLALSPIIGDRSRSFFNFERIKGTIVQICCPTCDEPLPIYTTCTCGADLVAMFTSPKVDFGNCIGICQRIGCLHAEVITSRDLRLYSRLGFFPANEKEALPDPLG